MMSLYIYVNSNCLQQPWITYYLYNSIVEDDKSGKGSEQLRIVNFSDRSLG